MSRKWQDRSKGLLIIFSLMFLVLQPVWGVREERVEMTWGELGTAVTGRDVVTILRSGAEVEGKVVSVEAQALRIEISKASGNYSRGHNSIPRSEVSVLRLETRSGPWRAIGATIGGGAGAAAGIPIYSWFDNEGNGGTGGAIAAGLIGGGAVLGFLVGRSSDKKALVISVTD